MTRVAAAIMLSASMLAGCSEAPRADLKAQADAVAAVENGIREAYRAKDPAKLATYYASDATFYVPGEMRPRIGPAAIAEGAKEDFADPAFRVTFTTGKVGVSAAGDTAYAKGSFTAAFTDPQTKAAGGYSGYYLTLFGKQTDGSWKVIEDMVSPAS